MESQTVKNILAVRAGWSKEERRARKDLAGAMQLQLRALVILSKLSFSKAAPQENGKVLQQEKQSISVASAC